MKMRKRKILHVDENEDDFVILRDLIADIRPASYSLFWAPDSTEGLKMLHEQDFDLCLVDYHLKTTNGIEFLNTLSAKRIDVPVILLSGQGNSDVDQKAVAAGAVDHLIKNRISSNILKRILHYTIANHQADKARFFKEFGT